jgi:hypothetical protein
MENPNRNRKIFIGVFIVFTLGIALLAIDMASRTTAPWNKPRQLNRALPGALPLRDTLLMDSLLPDTNWYPH